MAQARPTIMIADDSAAHRGLARATLEAAGYRVVEADDGAATVRVALSGEAQLLVIDVVMPKMNGLDAIKILRAKLGPRCPPILILSARVAPGARIDGLRAGADDYLGKPFEPAELLARVQGLLRKPTSPPVRAAEGDPKASAREDPKISAQASSASSYRVRGTSTGVEMMAGFPPVLATEFERAHEYREPLSVLIVEVDDQTAGERGPAHTAAADIVRDIVSAMVGCLSENDRLFFDGRRQLAICAPSSHFSSALALAERILFACRDALEIPRAAAVGTSWSTPSSSVRAQLSVGVAFYPSPDVSCALDLERIALLAVQTASAEGRGRICLYQHQGYIYAPDQP